MITKIPEGQICQAFDPRMIKTEEELRKHNTNLQPNTSCLAPAYVYVEGKHGKRFLCDSHYYYELYMNGQSYSAPNHSVKEIYQFISEIHSKEGSIYETGEITQIIQNGLSKIKNGTIKIISKY